jgi:hypothetical protein
MCELFAQDLSCSNVPEVRVQHASMDSQHGIVLRQVIWNLSQNTHKALFTVSTLLQKI